MESCRARALLYTWRGVDDDPDDASVGFFGPELPCLYLALAESHLDSQMIDLFSHEPQQLWMTSVRLIFALLAAQRHERVPSVLQLQVTPHVFFIIPCRWSPAISRTTNSGIMALMISGGARHLLRASGGVLVLQACLLSGCATSQTVPNLFDTQARIERYVSSGQYDAAFAAVIDSARTYMERRAPQVTKPAIVLDIDETSLSNWPAYRINGWARIASGPCDLKVGPCGLRAWQAMGSSKALVPTLELAKRAGALGVAVFFITGRPANLREQTDRNLRQEGYEPAGLILMPEGAAFKSAVDFKAPERRKITEQGYTIILSLGDQESDLSGGYAEKIFKLPNPVYFLP